MARLAKVIGGKLSISQPVCAYLFENGKQLYDDLYCAKASDELNYMHCTTTSLRASGLKVHSIHRD